MVVFAELDDDIIDAVTLDEHSAVRVDIADGAEDTKKVEADKGLVVAEFLYDALEELRLGNSHCDGAGEATHLEERVEQVLEGISLGVDETPQQCVEGLRFDKLVFYPSCFVLQPRDGEILRGTPRASCLPR